MLDVDEHPNDAGIFVEFVWDRPSEHGTHSSSSRKRSLNAKLLALRRPR
jgi:hypothetical protein